MSDRHRRDEPAPAAPRHLPNGLTTAEQLVALELYSADSALTPPEVAERTGLSDSGTQTLLADLGDRGLAVGTERPTEARGRNPTEYRLADDTALMAALGDAADEDPDPEVVERDVVATLATIHYCAGTGLSAARASRIATETDYTSGRVGGACRRLHDDGIIEDTAVGDSGRAQWRLVGVDEYTPLYGGGDGDA